MGLPEILEELPVVIRGDFLKRAYRPERREIADALISYLTETNRVGDLAKVLEEQIAEARKSEEPKREKELTIKFIYAHGPEEVERLVKKANNPEIYETVIAHCREDYNRWWRTGVHLLEHLDRKEEAREFALEAARVLDKGRKEILSKGVILSNHGVDSIYLHLNMFKEAVEVQLDNKDFNGAIGLAQKYLNERELLSFYQRVYAAAEGQRYNSGFPIQIRAAELLKDKELLKRTKIRYLGWLFRRERHCPLDLIKEVGTPEQLRAEFDRRINFQTEEGYPSNLAHLAEEAYKDLGDKKYAEIAMNTYERLGNFPKALEYARLVDDQKAAVLQEAVSLL